MIFFVQFPEVSVDRMNFLCIKIHLVSSSKRWNVTQSHHYGLQTGAVKLKGNGAKLVNEANSARI